MEFVMSLIETPVQLFAMSGLSAEMMMLSGMATASPVWRVWPLSPLCLPSDTAAADTPAGTVELAVYGPPMNSHCTALDGPATVRITTAR
jgi:hypothetical protein